MDLFDDNKVRDDVLTANICTEISNKYFRKLAQEYPYQFIINRAEHGHKYVILKTIDTETLKELKNQGFMIEFLAENQKWEISWK